VLARLRGKAIDLLYPPRCVHCGRFGDAYLCDPCVATMPPAGGEGTCPHCWAPWNGAGNCDGCWEWRFALDGARAAFRFEGAARAAVHALKYEGVRAIAPRMAALMARLDMSSVDAVYPVPLHRGRERERGFNQARELLATLGWEQGPGELKRIRKTDAQARQQLRERRTNVRGAFAYEGPRLDGRHVALLDDVVTSGSTAVECAKVLRDAGARSVVIFAFARANPAPAKLDRVDA
jgi:ComF family protein